MPAPLPAVSDRSLSLVPRATHKLKQREMPALGMLHRKEIWHFSWENKCSKLCWLANFPQPKNSLFSADLDGSQASSRLQMFKVRSFQGLTLACRSPAGHLHVPICGTGRRSVLSASHPLKSLSLVRAYWQGAQGLHWGKLIDNTQQCS